jgi:hypothetical protein
LIDEMQERAVEFRIGETLLVRRGHAASIPERMRGSTVQPPVWTVASGQGPP